MNLKTALKAAGAYQGYRYLKNQSAKAPTLAQSYLLNRLGLETKSSTAAAVLGGVGFFALGVLVGSALGVMFAPMTGTDMRNTIREQGMKGVVDKTRTAIPTTSPSA